MTEPLHITLNFPFYHTVAFFALVFGPCFLSLALTVVFLPYMSTHIYLLSPLYFSLNIFYFFYCHLKEESVSISIHSPCVRNRQDGAKWNAGAKNSIWES